MVAASRAALFALAIALVFFYAPIDADQGLSQKIFFFHVPIALTAYACFGWGAWKALRHLWKRDPGADLESYVAIHQGVIFGTLTLLTGSIWARISWGVWWVWGDDQLVLFLVLFLFYCAYFMLRYSVEPGALAREHVRRLRALRRRPDPDLVPRDPDLAEHHPPGRVHAQRAADDALPVPHLLRLLARDALRCSRRSTRLELAGKRLDTAAARAARAPRMTPSEKYTAAAYLVVFVGVLAYVLIIASKLQRLQRQVGELVEKLRERGSETE